MIESMVWVESYLAGNESGKSARVTKVALAVLISLCLVTQVHATTYYTSTSGNNANTCATAQNPGANAKRTIAAGMGCLVSGNADTLIVQNGTYAEGLDNTLTASGASWENATTVTAENARMAIIQPPAGAQRALRIRGSTGNVRRYMIIKDFVMDCVNCSSDVIKLDAIDAQTDTHHIRIQNCELKNAGLGNGILTGGEFNEFIDNVIHDNGFDFHFHGIYMVGQFHLISGGEYYGHFGGGFQIASNPTNSHTVEKIRSHNNGYGAIMSDSFSQNVLRNSLLYNNNVTTMGGGGVGLSLNGSREQKVYHNTIYGNTTKGIDAVSTMNLTMKNNIVFSNPSGNITVSSGTGTVNQNNTTVDPSFLNAAAGNFHLQAGSVAINAGQNLLADVQTDFDGVARDTTPETGAYQFTGGDATPPAVPTGLTISSFTGVLTMFHDLLGFFTALSIGLSLWHVRARLTHLRNRAYVWALTTCLPIHVEEPTLTVESALREAEAILREPSKVPR